MARSKASIKRRKQWTAITVHKDTSALADRLGPMIRRERHMVMALPKCEAMHIALTEAIASRKDTSCQGKPSSS